MQASTSCLRVLCGTRHQTVGSFSFTFTWSKNVCTPTGAFLGHQPTTEADLHLDYVLQNVFISGLRAAKSPYFSLYVTWSWKRSFSHFSANRSNLKLKLPVALCSRGPRNISDSDLGVPNACFHPKVQGNWKLYNLKARPDTRTTSSSTVAPKETNVCRSCYESKGCCWTCVGFCTNGGGDMVSIEKFHRSESA